MERNTQLFSFGLICEVLLCKYTGSDCLYSERNMLNIPYVSQPSGSPFCGAACASMLIQYYKNQVIPTDQIWLGTAMVSPETGRQYTRTSRLQSYLSDSFFKCTTVQIRPNKLSKLLDFCLNNDLAPIINHKYSKELDGGHYSVVNGYINDVVSVNDPDDKSRTSFAINVLEELMIRNKGDEQGHNTVIVPIFNKFPRANCPCQFCGSIIDMSLSRIINDLGERVIEAELCTHCEAYNKVPERSDK